MIYGDRWLKTALIAVALIAVGHGSGALVYSTPIVSGLYVPNAGADSITVYAPDASGNVAPLRTISGPLTGIRNPIGVVLDGAGTLYVANNDGNTSSITVYAPGASGNVAPLRTISGPLTGLNSVDGVALDTAGNIYVANSTTFDITVHPPASGNVAPVRTIRGANTGLVAPPREPDPIGPGGVALDGTGTLYVANWGTNSINVYAPGATGNVVPLRIISGASTGLDRPGSIFLRP